MAGQGVTGHQQMALSTGCLYPLALQRKEKSNEMEPDYKARKRGEPTMLLRDRLYGKMRVNPYTDCREWQGYKRNGYGRITTGSRTDDTRRTSSAHRVSYELEHGEIPEGMEVCHKCDNPSCINPKHLFLGTRQDNVNDREAKGRNIVQSGEANRMAKLTQKEVKEARQKRARYKTPYAKLADKYGVCKKNHDECNKRQELEMRKILSGNTKGGKQR